MDNPVIVSAVRTPIGIPRPTTHGSRSGSDHRDVRVRAMTMLFADLVAATAAVAATSARKDKTAALADLIASAARIR